MCVLKTEICLSYSRKLQMMLYPRDIICHSLSLCIAMLPASCFITPHLFAAFPSRQKHLLKLQRQSTMDTVYPDVTLPGRETEKLCSDANPLASAAKAAGNFLCGPLLPIYCQAINSESVDEG